MLLIVPNYPTNIKCTMTFLTSYYCTSLQLNILNWVRIHPCCPTWMKENMIWNETTSLLKGNEHIAMNPCKTELISSLLFCTYMIHELHKCEIQEFKCHVRMACEAFHWSSGWKPTNQSVGHLRCLFGFTMLHMNPIIICISMCIQGPFPHFTTI